MPRLNSLPCLALALIIAFLAVQAEGRAFFGTGSFFQDAQLNNATTTGLGLFGSFLEALASLHQTHHHLSSSFVSGK